jgi:hypothetical protein
MAKENIPGSQGDNVPVFGRGSINSATFFSTENYIGRRDNVNSSMHPFND